MESPHPMVAEGDLFKIHTKKYGWYIDAKERTSACLDVDDLVLVLRDEPNANACVVVHNGRKMTIDKLTLWQIARLEKP